MHRCIQLAKLGEKSVSPNPMVGAVLVYEDRIIGEGFHQYYGGVHAEVNCINSVLGENIENIKNATLYVNLEPCNHFGKTPPCTDLIIKNGIKKVVIGTQDGHELVDGAGIQKLRAHNIDVVFPVLKEECLKLNEIFFNFHHKKRPFITLKWAQSADGFIGKKDECINISNDLSKRHAHLLRAKHDAILVGKNTVITDNPKLNTRYNIGKSPIICVIDSDLQVPNTAKIFESSTKVFIFNTIKQEVKDNVYFIKLDSRISAIPQICQFLFEQNIISLLVEGGAITLQKWINENFYDKIFIYKSNTFINEGILAPIYPKGNSINFVLEDNMVEEIDN